MTIEVFLGGLATLTVAAIIIVAMTSSRRETYPDNRTRRNDTASRRKRSDR